MREIFLKFCAFVLYVGYFPVFFMVFMIATVNEEFSCGCPFDRSHRWMEKYFPKYGWAQHYKSKEV